MKLILIIIGTKLSANYSGTISTQNGYFGSSYTEFYDINQTSNVLPENARTVGSGSVIFYATEESVFKVEIPNVSIGYKSLSIKRYIGAPDAGTLKGLQVSNGSTHGKSPFTITVLNNDEALVAWTGEHNN